MDKLESAALTLRERRKLLRGGSAGRLQERAVQALSEAATRLLGREMGGFDPEPDEQTPLEAVWLSLQATLGSWNSRSLGELIDSEQARAPSSGPELTLHIIASNTPLLAWTSVARALLVESASLVRLPQNAPDVAAWTRRFLGALREVDEPLLGLIHVDSWPVIDVGTTRAALDACDCALVYGSDDTINSIRSLAPYSTRIIGFGSRISLGVVLDGADLKEAARGAALDIAIFDQQGCLSPQTFYAQQDRHGIERFVEFLAESLDDCARLFPQRTDAQASRIREAADIVRFAEGAAVAQDPRLRWTIAYSPSLEIDAASVPGFVTVRPMTDISSVSQAIERSQLWNKVQGMSVAAPDSGLFAAAASWARSIGVSYVCRPGMLQRPPFSWPEDNLPVLRSLL